MSMVDVMGSGKNDNGSEDNDDRCCRPNHPPGLTPEPLDQNGKNDPYADLDYADGGVDPAYERESVTNVEVPILQDAPKKKLKKKSSATFEKRKPPNGPPIKAGQNAVYEKNRLSEKKRNRTGWKWNHDEEKYEKGEIKKEFHSCDEDSIPHDAIIHAWVEIPWWARGLLIGKNGEDLKKIRDQTGVQRGYLPPDRYAIYFKGERCRVEDAEALVYTMLKEVKNRIDIRSKHNVTYATYQCPPHWNHREHINLKSTSASITPVLRWVAKATDKDDEPIWEEAPSDKETLIMIRSSNDEEPSIFTKLCPNVKYYIQVPNFIVDQLLTTKDENMNRCLTQIGIAAFEIIEREDASNSTDFVWTGTRHAITQVSQYFSFFLRMINLNPKNQASTTDSDKKKIDVFKLMYLDRKFVEDQFSNPAEIEYLQRQYTGVTIQLLERKVSYSKGQTFFDDPQETYFLYLQAPDYTPLMLAEQGIQEMIRTKSYNHQAYDWNNWYFPPMFPPPPPFAGKGGFWPTPDMFTSGPFGMPYDPYPSYDEYFGNTQSNNWQRDDDNGQWN